MNAAKIITIRRIVSMLKKLIFCTTIAALLCPPAFAVDAVVTDLSGQEYNVKSIKLTKGSKLKVVCGGARMEVPFKTVSAMRIAQGLISSVDGNLYFAVEISARDGSVIGDFEGDKRCYVLADNGVAGKTASKAKFSSPLSNIGAVTILGKKDEKKGGKEDSEDESEE